MRGASRGRLEAGQIDGPGNRSGTMARRSRHVSAKSGGCGARAMCLASTSPGRRRVPVRLHYESLRLVSSLDAGQAKAAKSAGSSGAECIAPVPGSTGPTAENRRGGRADAALRDGPQSHREPTTLAPRGAPRPSLGSDGYTARARSSREDDAPWLAGWLAGGTWLFDIPMADPADRAAAHPFTTSTWSTPN